MLGSSPVPLLSTLESSLSVDLAFGASDLTIRSIKGYTRIRFNCTTESSLYLSLSGETVNEGTVPLFLFNDVRAVAAVTKAVPMKLSGFVDGFVKQAGQLLSVIAGDIFDPNHGGALVPTTVVTNLHQLKAPMEKVFGMIRAMNPTPSDSLNSHFNALFPANVGSMLGQYQTTYPTPPSVIGLWAMEPLKLSLDKRSDDLNRDWLTRIQKLQSAFVGASLFDVLHCVLAFLGNYSNLTLAFQVDTDLGASIAAGIRFQHKFTSREKWDVNFDTGFSKEMNPMKVRFDLKARRLPTTIDINVTVNAILSFTCTLTVTPGNMDNLSVWPSSFIYLSCFLILFDASVSSFQCIVAYSLDQSYECLCQLDVQELTRASQSAHVCRSRGSSEHAGRAAAVKRHSRHRVAIGLDHQHEKR